jgi:hypothetical protein
MSDDAPDIPGSAIFTESLDSSSQVAGSSGRANPAIPLLLPRPIIGVRDPAQLLLSGE